MGNKKPLYKNIYFWSLLLFLIYSIIGFFVAPKLIKSSLVEISKTELNSEVEIEVIRFNPFKFSIDIEQLKFLDQDKTQWFSAKKVHVNLSLFKSIFGNISLSDIGLEQPQYYFHLAQEANGTVIKYPRLTESDSGQHTPLKLDIANISINQGIVSYFDKSTEAEVELKLNEIAFKHFDFTTDDKNSNFQLNFITENQDSAEIKGELNLAKMTVIGEWSLNNFSTATIFKFVEDKQHKFQGFQNQSGYIIANGGFEFNSQQQQLPKFSIQNLQLKEFSTQDTSSTNEPQISIPHLSLNSASFDLNHQSVEIESIQTQRAEILASFIDNNKLLFNPNETKQISNESAQNDKPWHFTIGQITNSDLKLLVNKINNDEVQQNSLLINNTITKLSNNPEAVIQTNFSIVPDGSGKIQLDASLELDPLKIDATVKVDDINLNSAQAWIPDDIQLFIESGLLSLQQQFKLQNDEFISQGSISLSDLNLLDSHQQTFLKIIQLDLQENKIDSATKIIDLNNINLSQAEGNLSVSEESQLNISTIIVDPVDKNKTKDTIKETKNDWIINIKQVEMIDLKTNFTDRSIKPNYHSELTNINGKIKGLSSTNTAKADVDISAILDTYGKISIKGKINPLTDKAYTDLDINVENLDLQRFNSYSSQHIGFPINKGKAFFKLNYKLNQSLLKGINDLEFRQLELGDKMQKEGAINLPLKLAIALLTDSKGVMPIYLPVSGRLDDPEFSYGGLVFKAFFKLITGIVASPFKLLGKLVPNGEKLDMSGVQFIAGTDELKAEDIDKLKAMKQILEKRPKLVLELTGVANSIEDKRAIQQNLLLTTMQLKKPPDLSDVAQVELIKKTYIELFSNEQWQDSNQKASVDEVLNIPQLQENSWKQMLESFESKALQQLDLLAPARAQKIQQLLIENYQVPEQSIFLKSHQQSEEFHPQVKFGITN